MASTSIRNSKTKAFLAGGLVLGVGAAVTLAAWNDSEFAEGIFNSGSFDIEGSADGTTFASHDTPAEAQQLSFEVAADNLAPGDVVAAPYAVQLTGDSTSDANVVVGTESSTGSLSGLTYELIRTDTFGCDAGTTGTTLVPAGTPLGTTPADVSFQLAQSTTGGQPGETANLCFKVSADGALEQGEQNSTTWSFVAESL